MVSYLLQRLGLATVTCLFISALTFLIIRLPPGASIVQHAAYTGYQGATGSDVRVLSGEGQQGPRGSDKYLH